MNTEKPDYSTVLGYFAFFLRQPDMPYFRKSLAVCLDIITSHNECTIEEEHKSIELLTKIKNEISDISGIEAAIRICAIACKKREEINNILDRCLRLTIFTSLIDITRTEKEHIYILWELRDYINRILIATTQNPLED